MPVGVANELNDGASTIVDNEDEGKQQADALFKKTADALPPARFIAGDKSRTPSIQIGRLNPRRVNSTLSRTNRYKSEAKENEFPIKPGALSTVSSGPLQIQLSLHKPNLLQQPSSSTMRISAVHVILAMTLSAYALLATSLGARQGDVYGGGNNPPSGDGGQRFSGNGGPPSGGPEQGPPGENHGGQQPGQNGPPSDPPGMNAGQGGYGGLPGQQLGQGPPNGKNGPPGGQGGHVKGRGNPPPRPGSQNSPPRGNGNLGGQGSNGPLGGDQHPRGNPPNGQGGPQDGGLPQNGHGGPGQQNGGGNRRSEWAHESSVQPNMRRMERGRIAITIFSLKITSLQGHVFSKTGETISHGLNIEEKEVPETLWHTTLNNQTSTCRCRGFPPVNNLSQQIREGFDFGITLPKYAVNSIGICLQFMTTWERAGKA
ncbi:uncharacterized protein EV420DRAFT_1485465 [Desarmillaria tabescens]|uniref:Uncharacterized protein n=1 Tax=Armillaria tabescens TaxID=1929756 RepID=A0AA39JFW1_ARMTA|nr:uncharacterized protein EV420DRAFT_1485465 [Desarmillaria tabescens]KAK0442030.1 hypothetical protein EV420DRAFT_1485465 [Desarmillaria tabescens]